MAAALTRHQGSRPRPDPTAEPDPSTDALRSWPHNRDKRRLLLSRQPKEQQVAQPRYVSRSRSRAGPRPPPHSKQQGRLPSPLSLTSGKRQQLPPHVGQQAVSHPPPQR
ncbi:hypothetical protein NDU88_000180 [Pleurodeles waltl]|uniref:Uncharacterized protein n=1 Tax=Pleurodeles waltl TaxID=8319 RepID=A0AAV7KN05_PLEWA|nr:hypothetical protein NDU88_000180 [Pleurodeles waltl]